MELHVIFALFSLLFTVSSANLVSLLNSNGLAFFNCFANHSPASPSISSVVYAPYIPSYDSIFQNTIQNLRFNSSMIQRPQYIIVPKRSAHVQAAIICSKKHSLQLRIRSGGHDYEGLSYKSKTPFVLIDLVKLRKVRVSLRKATAWVQAGATLGELYYQIAKETSTLGFPAGTCPTIGVGGHISGGGQGSLIRKYGLAADNVVDAILVKADGQIVNRATMDEDLFWAIRGGGGASFGVILEWKVKLVPVPTRVTAFNVVKTLDEGATNLIYQWQNIANKLPEELYIRIILTVGKNDDGIRTIRANFNSLFLGTVDQLMPLMDERFPELGLEYENCREMNWIESVLYMNDGKSDEPIEVLLDGNRNVTKGFFKAKSDYVTKPISENDLQAIWNVMKVGEAGIMIWTPYGGRMSEISPSETPFPHRKGILYSIQYYSKWQEKGIVAEAQHLGWINKLYYFMTPFVSEFPRAAYLNYRDLDIGINTIGTFAEAKVWGEKYFKNNFKRLAVVKGKVDPENYFKNEQSIVARS